MTRSPSLPRPEIQRLLAVVRRLLKDRGLRYHDVAAALGISLPTVKRIFATGAIEFERLLAMADWLGLGFYDLVDLSREADDQCVRLSSEEEAFFAAHPGYLGFFMALKGGIHTPTSVATQHGLSPRSEKRYVQRLEAMGFLARTEAGDVVVLRRGKHFVWSEWGPLGRIYARYFLRAMCGRAAARLVDGATEADQKPMLMTGSKRLTAAERDEFQQDLEALETKYRRRSTLNSAAAGQGREAQTMSYVFVADVWKDDFFDKLPEL